CQEISTRKDFVERGHLDLEISRLFRSDERIVSHTSHTESPRATRDSPSDAPQADDAERLTLQFDSNKTLSLPETGPKTRVRLGNSARESDQQRHGMFRGGDRVAIRGIHHNDASGGCTSDVDIVHTNTSSPDNFKLRCLAH